MTIKEAILTLNANVVFACERAGFDSATVEMVEDALDTIEDALKAQEPMRAEDEHTEMGLRFAECGNCHNAIRRPWAYCPFCGRAVKWDD